MLVILLLTCLVTWSNALKCHSCVERIEMSRPVLICSQQEYLTSNIIDQFDFELPTDGIFTQHFVDSDLCMKTAVTTDRNTHTMRMGVKAGSWPTFYLLDETCRWDPTETAVVCFCSTDFCNGQHKVTVSFEVVMMMMMMMTLYFGLFNF